MPDESTPSSNLQILNVVKSSSSGAPARNSMSGEQTQLVIPGNNLGEASASEALSPMSNWEQRASNAKKATEHLAHKDYVKGCPECEKVKETQRATAVVDGAIPNAQNAVIPPEKFTKYALNPDHPVGKNKAVVYESALGYNLSNSDDLIKKVRAGVTQNPAALGEKNQYGQKYNVDMPITGPNGETKTVETAWITKSGEDSPTLVTAFVKKEKKRK